MLIFWKIRYFNRSTKDFVGRDLILDTKTLESVLRAAVELAIETKNTNTDRYFLKFRALFKEVNFDQLDEQQRIDPGGFKTIALHEYCEDETGKEMTHTEVGRILTGNPQAVSIPAGARQHDIDLMLSEPKPLPISGVSLTDTGIRVLGYFARDLRELQESALMKNGPGSISWRGHSFTDQAVDPVLETSVTDEELRSFVTIFRRLYMAKEPANLLKTAEIFTSAIGDYPKVKWIAAEIQGYEAKLNSPCDVRPFLQSQLFSITRKRIIDVFIYTQYAQPSSGPSSFVTAAEQLLSSAMNQELRKV
jgi:hypothetical protein